jgi:hypothetical protein
MAHPHNYPTSERGYFCHTRTPPRGPAQIIPLSTVMCRLFINGARELALYQYGISMNKLVDYFASGRPIIFAGPSSFDPVETALASASRRRTRWR